MDDRTIYSAPAGYYLLILRGPGQGRMFLILDGLTTIGRAVDNTIVLDPSDVKASRRHAAIRLGAGMASVEDLGSKNGTLLDGSPVTKAPLPPGAELCVGETVFVLSQVGCVPPTPEDGLPLQDTARPGRRRALYAAVAALALGALLLAIFRGGEDTQKPGKADLPPLETPSGQPSQTQGAQRQTPDGQAPQPLPAVQANPQVDQSLESMRLGQFFYNSGNLKKAVEQWREALRLDPANAQVSKLLARAESELDQLVDRHYRQALLALRYQRTDEARAELLQVVENSPNPGDERTQDSLKKLNELGGR